MASAVICDSCEKPIVDMTNRAQLLIFTPEEIADPTLDLCGDCVSGVAKDTKVKRGQDKAKARIKAMMQEIIPPTPPVEGVDPETGVYVDMPPPPTPVVPGIDPRTGKGQRADGKSIIHDDGK